MAGVLALVLAGCSGSDPGSATPEASPGEATPGVGASATADSTSAYCQAAIDAGMAQNVADLREAIDALSAAMPEGANEQAVEGLETLKGLYAGADDLVAAGKAYADADETERARMQAYFDFQGEQCN